MWSKSCFKRNSCLNGKIKFFAIRFTREMTAPGSFHWHLSWRITGLEVRGRHVTSIDPLRCARSSGEAVNSISSEIGFMECRPNCLFVGDSLFSESAIKKLLGPIGPQCRWRDNTFTVEEAGWRSMGRSNPSHCVIGYLSDDVFKI